MKMIYETKDGKQFTDEQEAKDYEYKLTLLEASRDFLEKIGNYIPDEEEIQREYNILLNFLKKETNF